MFDGHQTRKLRNLTSKLSVLLPPIRMSVKKGRTEAKLQSAAAKQQPLRRERRQSCSVKREKSHAHVGQVRKARTEAKLRRALIAGQGLISDLHPNKNCFDARVENLVKAFLIDIAIVIG